MKYALLLVTLIATLATAQQPGSICEQKVKFGARVGDNASLPGRSPDMALVIVLRTGAGIFTVGTAADGRWVGATKKNTYFAFELVPGEHRLCAAGGIGHNYLNPGFLRLQTEKGKTYYIEQTIDSPSFSNNIRLSLLDPEQGEHQLKRSRLAVMTQPESSPADVRN